MKIATFNIQNRYLQDNNLTDEEYLSKLEDIITKNKIDIIGMQEVVSGVMLPLQAKFNTYSMSRIPILKSSSFNEYNSILTHYEIVSINKYRLPFMGSIIPRVAIETILKVNNINIRVINTHLALYKYHKVKMKQLDKLLDIVKKDNIPTIIMGDFNLRKDAYELKYFEKELEKLNIKKIANKNNTFQDNILDYIFVSNSFDVKKIEVIDTKISDHNILISTMYIN